MIKNKNKETLKGAAVNQIKTWAEYATRNGIDSARLPIWTPVGTGHVDVVYAHEDGVLMARGFGFGKYRNGRKFEFTVSLPLYL